METFGQFPKPGEISWHDVTPEMIDTDDLPAARVLAEVRLRGVMAAIKDIEDELKKNEGLIGPTSWEEEKVELVADIEVIQGMLTTITTETRD